MRLIIFFFIKRISTLMKMIRKKVRFSKDKTPYCLEKVW